MNDNDFNGIKWAKPNQAPEITKFCGRETELEQCRAAWGIDRKGKLDDENLFRLHFRLEGLPGVGKNEIVYKLARDVRDADGDPIPFYTIQGHEELTPEDLTLVLVPRNSDQGPDKNGNPGTAGLELRASPLATALYEGGIFFFDEINRVPERSLAPLASVLDNRQELYSAMTGLRIEPKSPEAKKRFRFCSAMNPLESETGRGGLPPYIDERTLPAITVKPPHFDHLCEILRTNLTTKGDLDSELLAKYIEEFDRRFATVHARRPISARKALTLMMYAINHVGPDGSIERTFDMIADDVISELAQRTD